MYIQFPPSDPHVQPDVGGAAEHETSLSAPPTLVCTHDCSRRNTRWGKRLAGNVSVLECENLQLECYIVN